jgi:hypothetical protein
MPNSNPANSPTRWKPGKSGNPGGLWKPGQSGNAAGKSKLRVQFQTMFADALLTDDPEKASRELSTIVWEAARKHEAWACTLLYSRILPTDFNVRISRGDDEPEQLDYTKLTDEEIEILERLLERATGATPQIEVGESQAIISGVRQAGLGGNRAIEPTDMELAHDCVVRPRTGVAVTSTGNVPEPTGERSPR